MREIRYFIFIFFIILPLQSLNSEIIIMSACDDKQDEYLKNEFIKLFFKVHLSNL